MYTTDLGCCDGSGRGGDDFHTAATSSAAGSATSSSYVCNPAASSSAASASASSSSRYSRMAVCTSDILRPLPLNEPESTRRMPVSEARISLGDSLARPEPMRSEPFGFGEPGCGEPG